MSHGRYTARHSRLAPRHGAEWTEEEDRRILAAQPGRRNRSLFELAAEFGRSHIAVAHRRSLLLQRQRAAGSDSGGIPLTRPPRAAIPTR